jgi:ketosteroid isomerase-like protein
VASATNMDLVRSIYAAWERGDYRSAQWADPEIEYVILGAGIFPSVSTRGLAGLREAARGNIEVWEDLRIMAVEYRELDGERVLVLDRRSGLGKHSRLEIEQFGGNGAHLFHLSHGKVTRLVVYDERDRAFADVGLPSEADPD